MDFLIFSLFSWHLSKKVINLFHVHIIGDSCIYCIKPMYFIKLGKCCLQYFIKATELVKCCLQYFIKATEVGKCCLQYFIKATKLIKCCLQYFIKATKLGKHCVFRFYMYTYYGFWQLHCHGHLIATGNMSTWILCVFRIENN